jgi:Major tropism determinant N-terminal domain
MEREYTLKLKRATAAKWVQMNPILGAGEPGYEMDTGKMKLGDGTTPWTTLDYFIPQPDVQDAGATLAEHITAPLPHTIYDDGPSLVLLYENAKV